MKVPASIVTALCRASPARSCKTHLLVSYSILLLITAGISIAMLNPVTCPGRCSLHHRDKSTELTFQRCETLAFAMSTFAIARLHQVRSHSRQRSNVCFCLR
ncbi:hypothetical protein EDB19DRAFT_180232 [Suillus lakei]|nr:hypothetical protein EDB19DRAFT_180232 [Suillus lakei]